MFKTAIKKIVYLFVAVLDEITFYYLNMQCSIA
jgi:hypothetical protein